MCLDKVNVISQFFLIQLFTIPFPFTLASLAFLCLTKLPELKAKIAGWKKKVTNNTWSSFYLSWFHLIEWLRKKDKITLQKVLATVENSILWQLDRKDINIRFFLLMLLLIPLITKLTTDTTILYEDTRLWFQIIELHVLWLEIKKYKLIYYRDKSTK